MTGVVVIPESFPASFYDASANICENASNITTGSDEGSTNKKEEKWIWVLDPLTRKLRVPLHLLAPTEATVTGGTVPSLCIAYLERRCRHPWCRQAHVHPAAIQQLRFEALNAPTCCHFHNDPHDISKLTNRFKYVRIVNNGSCTNSEPIPSDRVASTVGLLRYLVHNVPPSSSSDEALESEDKGAILNIPAKSVCRLHLAHRCRYLEDCNNIHICRESEAHLQLSPHVYTTLSNINSSTRTVVLTETCYSVSMLAAGDVSDAEFDALCDAHKSKPNSFSHLPSWNVTEVGSMAPEKGASGSCPSKSPLNHPSSNTLSPLSDCWKSFSLAPGVMPGVGHNPATATPYPFPSSHLRVYDVRPKHAPGRNPDRRDCATPTGRGRHRETPPGGGSALCGDSFARHDDHPTLQRRGGVGGGSAMPIHAGTLPHFSSSTEGSVSIVSSTVQTPIKGEAHRGFLLSTSFAGANTNGKEEG